MPKDVGMGQHAFFDEKAVARKAKKPHRHLDSRLRSVAVVVMNDAT
jgi:hypothetical protein